MRANRSSTHIFALQGLLLCNLSSPIVDNISGAMSLCILQAYRHDHRVGIG